MHTDIYFSLFSFAYAIARKDPHLGHDSRRIRRDPFMQAIDGESDLCHTTAPRQAWEHGSVNTKKISVFTLYFAIDIIKIK